MTTIDTRPETGSSLGTDTPAGRAVSGTMGWIITADHKRIGRLFIGMSVLFLVGMAVIGALLGFERLQPDSSALEANSMDQLFSLFRVGSSFFVVAPLLLGVSVAIVPLQLGARSLALPRAAALGLWSWAAGGVVVVVAYVNNGGPGGGDENMVDLFLMGLVLACIGLVISAGSVVVSVLTTRAPGMTIARVPLFAWSALVGAAALVFTLPVLVGNLVLLTVDHRYSRAAFGGNTGITSWMGWALTQPATYVYAIPALGIAADIIATATGRRQPMRGLVMLGIALFGTATLAAVTQRSHNLAWEGDGFFDNFGDKINDLLPYALFNLLPILGVLMVLGLGGLAMKDSRAQGFGAARLRPARSAHAVHGCPGPHPRPDPRPPARRHGVRGGCVRLRGVRGGPRRVGRHRPLGAEALGPADPGQGGDPTRPARLRGHHPRRIAVALRRLPGPAGGDRGRLRLRPGARVCSTRSSSPATC